MWLVLFALGLTFFVSLVLAVGAYLGGDSAGLVTFLILASVVAVLYVAMNRARISKARGKEEEVAWWIAMLWPW